MKTFFDIACPVLLSFISTLAVGQQIPDSVTTAGGSNAKAIVNPGRYSNLPAPDSSSYLWDATLMAEGMKLLMGEKQTAQKVAKKTAPYFIYPSPGVKEDMIKFRPLWTEALGLKSAISASASAFDAAWSEVMAAAAIESEEGTRAALAIANQHKIELEVMNVRLGELAAAAKKMGELRDPLVELKAVRKEYKKQLNEAQKIITGAEMSGTGWNLYTTNQKIEKGESKYIEPVILDVTEKRIGQSITIPPGHVISNGVPSGSLQRSTIIEWTEPPKQIIPGQVVTITFIIEDDIVGDHKQYVPGGSTCTAVLGIYVTAPFAGMKPGNLSYVEDGVTYYYVGHLNENSTPDKFLRWSAENELFKTGKITDTKTFEVKFPEGKAGSKLRIRLDVRNNTLLPYKMVRDFDYSFGTSESKPDADPGTVTAKQKQQRIEEIDANISIIRSNISLDKKELVKETNASSRTRLDFRIMNAEANLQAEEDLKRSIQTGQNIHTRTAFDDFAKGQFIENIRRDQMKIEEFQRGSASLQRLAALLPTGDADAARSFISRQVTSSDFMQLNTGKLRHIAGILYNQVHAKADEYAAKGEEEAAQVGLDMAMRAKAAADGGMMVTSLIAGPWLNVAYQGVTGTWDGGMVEGITRAASTYSMPSFLAVQALQGYQSGGWKQAGENLAISYVTGKAIQYGLTKTFSAAGQLFKPNTKETFELARFKQSRASGEALVKDLQRTEGEVIRLRAALKIGDAGAETKLRQALISREAKTAAVHENMHAKNFLKYKGDYHTQKIFNEDLGTIHQKAQQKFHEAMQAKGWSKANLKEFRNASSAGTSGMDYDIGLDEAATLLLTKDGSKATLYQWQKEAQQAWNLAYKAVTGRSAQRSWETLTTSVHPEAYKDLAWLSGNSNAVSNLWKQQAADVTRYKNWHMMNDPNLSVYEKLQEVSRGTTKDMQTKLLSVLSSTANKEVGNEAVQKTNQYWRKIYGVLEKFGKGDADPVTTSRQIRELTGGKSITEVTEDMTTLMEILGKK